MENSGLQDSAEWRVVKIVGNWARLRPVSGEREERFVARYLLPDDAEAGDVIRLPANLRESGR